MTISKVTTLHKHKGTRGLVLVDDAVLSTFLGDAEGPAHTEWSENESRLAATYEHWKSRLRFVKRSLQSLIELLSPDPEGLDVDLLKDIFSIEQPASKGRSRRKSNDRGTDNPQDSPEVPESMPPLLSIRPLSGRHGFSVHAGSADATFPIRARVRAAYAVPFGNPFSQAHYSKFDFVFNREIRGAIKLQYSNDVELVGANLNAFEFVARTADFEINATGFDPLRDLVIDARVVEHGDAANV